MAAVVKRTPSSRLNSSPSSSSMTTAATSTTANTNTRRHSTRASEAAAAAATESISIITLEAPITQDASMLTPPPVSARPEPAAPGMASYSSVTGIANNNASLFSQNRAMLLSGLSKGDPAQLPSPVMKPLQRSDSGSGPLQADRRLTPLVTVTSTASQQRHHPLSAHPHHLGGVDSPVAQSPRTISPCVYVKAVGLRRSSAVSLKKDVGADRNDKDMKTEHTEKTSKNTSPTSATKSSDAPLSTPPPESRLAVSARITPANSEKPPFTLQREFDLQELVEALPRPDHRRPSSVNILASPVLHSPHHTLFHSQSSTPLTTSAATGRKRPASDDAPASPHPNLRCNTRQSVQKQQLTPVRELPPPPSQYVADGRVPIPIRPHPSLGRLPGLAAIILSRRVEAGDTIEIPVPFPEAWPGTVSYVYSSTGDTEVTSEIKANLEYLGGQVTEV